jgi:hypothetical protein
VADVPLVIAPGGNPINLLKRILHEYVGFALICASGFLAADQEEELTKSISRIFTLFRPIG